VGALVGIIEVSKVIIIIHSLAGEGMIRRDANHRLNMTIDTICFVVHCVSWFGRAATIEHYHPNEWVACNNVFLHELEIRIRLGYWQDIELEILMLDVEFFKSAVNVSVKNLFVVATAGFGMITNLLLRNVSTFGQSCALE
jgi:hypothetical protein